MKERELDEYLEKKGIHRRSSAAGSKSPELTGSLMWTRIKCEAFSVDFN